MQKRGVWRAMVCVAGVAWGAGLWLCASCMWPSASGGRATSPVLVAPLVTGGESGAESAAEAKGGQASAGVVSVAVGTELASAAVQAADWFEFLVKFLLAVVLLAWSTWVINMLVGWVRKRNGPSGSGKGGGCTGSQ